MKNDLFLNNPRFVNFLKLTSAVVLVGGLILILRLAYVSDLNHRANLLLIEAGIKNYHRAFGEYPDNLDELSKYNILNPVPKKGVIYKIDNNKIILQTQLFLPPKKIIIEIK